MRHITLIIAVIALALAAPAFSGKGGNGNGNGNGNTGGGGGGGNVTPPSGSCSVEGNVVTGTNLPNWTLMNFMVTDASGTTGWVIGYTDDGTRAVDVPDRTSPTTYEFAGVTYGKDGARYDVFASCSA
jgi:hypothetical protein